MLSSLRRAGRLIRRSERGREVMIWITRQEQNCKEIVVWKLDFDMNRVWVWSTSSFLPSGNVCQDGINSTMWSLTQRSNSISLRHIDFLSRCRGSNLQICPNNVAERIGYRNNNDNNTIKINKLNRQKLHLYSWYGQSIPQRLVIAFEMASAVQTPFPQPDISSPSSNFENLSFTISNSSYIPMKKITTFIYSKS